MSGERERDMEKIFEQTLLYDFYGELLTNHQRKIYEDAVYNDMSLSELALEYGISRQGVHDLIKRCDRILQDYESKLHLVERFGKAKQKLGKIMELTEYVEEPRFVQESRTEDFCDRMKQIRELSEELKREL